MYEVDDKDKVIELFDFPEMETGAPLPIVLSDDYRTFLSYSLDFNWGATGAGAEPEKIAIVEFNGCRSFMFGMPNDEALEGHPLFYRGVQHYGFYEVKESSWIKNLEKTNSVHDRHNRVAFFANLHHFIITFHDTTFECVARDYEITTHEKPFDPIDEMRRRLKR
jgi:hypothetical protein